MKEITIDLKKVLGVSETFASYSGGIVDSLHLLLALACARGTYGYEILSRLGFSEEVAKSYYMKSEDLPHPSVVGAMALQILEYAEKIAKDLQYPVCDTQHLLLSIAYHRSSLGGKILLRHKVDYSTILSIVNGMSYHEIGFDQARAEEEEEVEEKTETEKPQLEENGYDLTAKAKRGEIQPIFGREKEIERSLRILARRSKNNPMIIGEPGVGKTAIVEGMALRFVKNEVPESLRGKRIYCLDLNRLVAGTRYRGDMEEKMKGIFEELTDGMTILFIDELHMATSAGSNEGGLSVANLLKQAMTKGSFSVIGATTIEDYKKYIEQDPALARRFNVVDIRETTVEETIEILRGLRENFEKHFSLKISDEAIVAAAELSKRFINDKFLPDKAIDLMDETCSKKSGSKGAAVCVEKEDVREIISETIGIPMTILRDDEANRLREMKEIMAKRVVGQEEAIESIVKAIKRSRSGLSDPTRPIGSFLFLGPTGVGKTETAKALAEFLFGSDNELIRIDMSEFMDKNSTSKLIGAPPGYVGYESGGALTDAVRRKPYSVILFDEIEKADDEIANILLQLLDDGRLTDGKGRTVDFTNCVVIMTGNVGTEAVQRREVGFGNTGQDASETEKKKRMDELKLSMRPEFINRIDNIVVFNKLNKENRKAIANILVERINRFLQSERNVRLEVSEEVLDKIVEDSFDSEYGARPLKRKIESEIEDRLSDEIIQKDLKNTALKFILVDGEPKIITTGG